MKTSIKALSEEKQIKDELLFHFDLEREISPDVLPNWLLAAVFLRSGRDCSRVLQPCVAAM